MHIKTETSLAAGLNLIFFGTCAYRALAKDYRLAGALSVGMLFATVASLSSWYCFAKGEGAFHPLSEGKKNAVKRIATLTYAPSMVLGATMLVSIAIFGAMGKLDG